MESSELQKTHLNLVSRPSRYCGVSDLFIIAHATVAYLLRALWLGGTLAFALVFVRLRASSLRRLRFAIPFLRVCDFCGGGVRSHENRNSSLDNCCTYMRARDKGKSGVINQGNGSARAKPNHLAGRCCYCMRKAHAPRGRHDSPASSTRVIDRGGVGRSLGQAVVNKANLPYFITTRVSALSTALSIAERYRFAYIPDRRPAL